MTRQLNLTGKNSNEIYTLVYPNNLITFCKYDFTPFLNHCTDLCRLANRTGEYNVDDVYAIRNSISGCHKYYEQNMRTVFEKIVVDCWIDYLCRQSEASVSALWQSFMRCKNDFEKAVFARLSEYRHNRAINEWTNLLKLQEYARQKTDFIFGVRLSGPSEAAARANYFDLMFNVAANEQGFSVSDIGASCVYSVGRVPNSPFVLSSASREILRNVLNGMDDANPRSKRRLGAELSDQTAMDAFDAVKDHIPDKNDSLVKTIIKSMSGLTQRVYLPVSFKAVIDLEIDALLESGGILQKCLRCGEYFLKDDEYRYDYCNRPQKDGTVCLDFAEGEPAPVVKEPEVLPEPEEVKTLPKKPLEKEYVNETLDSLYKEMAARVNVDMTQRDFSRWYQRELRLKELILFGQAGEDELQKFIEISRGDEFASKKQPPLFEKHEDDKTIAVTETGKEVKRFVFERVERSEEPPVKETLASSEQAANEAVQRLFAARQAAPPRPAAQPYYPSPQPYSYQSQQPYGQPKQITRIIRGGAANAGYKERPFDVSAKPKTVVIPNGEENLRKAPPVQQTQSAREEPVNDEDVKLYRDEEDVKIFTPRQSPYEEKIRRPLEEYKRGRESGTSSEEMPSRPEFSDYIEQSMYEASEPENTENGESAREVQIDGQLLADDVGESRPAPAASAKALSAYRTLAIPKVSTDDKKIEKADFSGVLKGISRSDGFRSDEEELDSNGMPISHKTQHVMNALFGPTRVSPFVKIMKNNLDDED